MYISASMTAGADEEPQKISAILPFAYATNGDYIKMWHKEVWDENLW